MASRFSQQKPDSTIKKNVINARQRARNAKRAQGFVVATSMAATILAGVFFAQHDVQVAATAQSRASSAVAMAIRQTANDAMPTPLITTIQVAAQAAATPQAGAASGSSR